ncbi:MAG: hypothetical protein JWO11_1156 [Nocardioides sp.]|nr:hypothetical protein [Nocardioides sp.]
MMDNAVHGRSWGGRALLARWVERAVRGSTPPFGRRASSRTRASGLTAAVLLVASVLMVPSAAQGAPGDVGSEGPSHAGTGTPTGTKRAESVLWFNDGYWWGNLWDTGSSDFHIFRFEAATTQWVDTGVATEPRANTHHDVLWDGTTLYVASHLFVNDGVPAASGFPSTMRRYSYNATTNTYTPLGSSQINNYKTETLSIDKDTTGQLWATWQQGNQIYLNNTGTDGTAWGTPFPIPGGDVSLDDTSALIAYGPRIGVMWSSQGTSAPASSDGFYWSVHSDGASRTSWSAPKGITTGPRTGDDHMNLKWLDSSGGRVFAAVKTSFTSSAQPLILLLAMDSAGSWTQKTIATVSECPNRVIVLIDEGAQRLRTFATYPKPSGTTNAGACNSSGGAIYEKSTPLNNINFTTAKTARIVDADQYVHNVSSTKQNLNNARTDGASTTNSGLMVIADVGSTSTYWYHYESGGTTPPPPDTTPPDTTITAGPSGTVTSTTAQFSFTSTEAGSFECQLDGAAYAPCTSPATYTGLAAGSHTFSVRATDAAGNTDATPATRTWTIGATDTTPPDTTITAGPTGTVTTTGATFQFSSSESGSTFECQLDAAAYAACTSPTTYTGLAAGSHTFSVRATDAAGNTDATPATRTWTIDTTSAGGIVRSSFSTAVNTTAATTLRIATPSGVVAGDVLVSCVSLNGGSIGSAGVPAGWTQLAAQTSLANPKVYGYYKVATSTEPANYAWTTSSVPSGGVIARYSGATGLDTAATSASGAAAASGTVGQVTTTTANAMLVGCMSVNSSSVTLSSPAGMTQVAETGDRRFELADGLQPTAGPSGTKTWTFSAAREWAGWLVALRSR